MGVVFAEYVGWFSFCHVAFCPVFCVPVECYESFVVGSLGDDWSAFYCVLYDDVDHGLGSWVRLPLLVSGGDWVVIDGFSNLENPSFHWDCEFADDCSGGVSDCEVGVWGVGVGDFFVDFVVWFSGVVEDLLCCCSEDLFVGCVFWCFDFEDFEPVSVADYLVFGHFSFSWVGGSVAPPCFGRGGSVNAGVMRWLAFWRTILYGLGGILYDNVDR